MARLLRLLLLLLGVVLLPAASFGVPPDWVPGPPPAAPPITGVPEVDAGALRSVLVLLVGGVLILTARRARRS
jgi:hypothetical protein